MNDNGAVIQIEGLYRRYKGFTLGPLDFSVPRGVVTAVIGPNGSGKTTAFNALMNFDPRAGGEIRIFGMHHQRDEVEIRKRLGYVGEYPILIEALTLDDFFIYVSGFYPDWDHPYCEDLIRRFELPRDRRIYKFSKGMKVRTALVFALAHRPELLILDEPTSGLDVEVRRDFLDEILEVVGSEERTVLFSSHNLNEVERVADNLLFLKNGLILLHDDKHRILDRHRRVLFTADAFPDIPSDWVLTQEQSGTRWRVETSHWEDLRNLLATVGVKDIEENPMTLEDVFIATMKKGRESEGGE